MQNIPNNFINIMLTIHLYCLIYIHVHNYMKLIPSTDSRTKLNKERIFSVKNHTVNIRSI